MFKRIILGYKDSPAGREALLLSARLLKGEGQLTLVHVIPSSEENFASSPDLQNFRMKTARRLCKLAAMVVTPELGKEPEVVLEKGDAVEALLQNADTRNADLIALGSPGRKRIAGSMFHSPLYKLIQVTKVSVLVVNSSEFAAPRDPNTFLLPYDGSKGSEVALHEACRLAAMREGARVVVMLSLPGKKFWSSCCQRRSQAQNEQIELLLSGVRTIGAQYGAPVRFKVQYGNPSASILKLSRRKDFDWVVVGFHSESGFSLEPAALEAISSSARIPVLFAKTKRSVS